MGEAAADPGGAQIVRRRVPGRVDDDDSGCDRCRVRARASEWEGCERVDWSVGADMGAHEKLLASVCHPRSQPADVGRVSRSSRGVGMTAPFLAACRREPTPTRRSGSCGRPGATMPEYRAVRERHRLPRAVQDARRRRRGDGDGRRAARRGRRDHLRGHPARARAAGRRARVHHAATGRSIHRPVARGADVDGLAEVGPRRRSRFVYEAVRRARAALPARVPLIGFAGAPFTLASYLIEGGGSRRLRDDQALPHVDRSRRLARAAWSVWCASVTGYLNAQIAAGRRRPCSSSTAGSAASRPPTTARTCCRTCAR